MIDTYGESSKGVCVAPHHLAASAGRDILGEGGNAIEAMIAMAASIAVVYPHMNGIGGDGFWLIVPPKGAPVTIQAAGHAAELATIESYRAKDYPAVPFRGGDAALTVPGAISGWNRALEIAKAFGGKIPLPVLLERAILQAKEGVPVSRSQSQMTEDDHEDLIDVFGFADHFMVDRKAPAVGQPMTQPRLADTLDHLARAGFEDFYRGDVAAALSDDLARAGSPLRRDDFASFHPRTLAPLHLKSRYGDLYNVAPPCQGLASLLILGLFERMDITQADGFDHIHALVEATKIAFTVREFTCCEPSLHSLDPQTFLDPAWLDRMVEKVDRKRTQNWNGKTELGDTIWMGAIDQDGLSVSYIQSIFFEFGSGVVSPQTGVLLQNRGAGFSLDPKHPNALGPKLRPFHTLNPAAARLNDGRIMVYGSMGGDGQPQFQAATFTRHVHFGQDLMTAISAPRWLFGKTWGKTSLTLKLENRIDPDVAQQLASAGHDVEILSTGYADMMGHAGAVSIHSNGRIEGAHDPRADGGAAVV